MEIFITMSLFVSTSALLPNNSIFKNKLISQAIVFAILTLLVVYIPFLNVYVSDMTRYVAAYKDMHYLSLTQIFQIYEWEPLFLLTQWFISRFSENPIVYVLFTFTLFIFLLVKMVNKMFIPWQRMFIVFAFACFPFFYMYVFDGIRQGLAIMLLMLGISYRLEKKNTLKFYLCLIAAGLFHTTAFVMAALVAIFLLFKIKLRTLLFVWFVAALLFVTGLNAKILNIGFISQLDYVLSYTSDYLMGTFGGEVNKLNFFIFTSFFLFVSLFLYRHMDLEQEFKEKYHLVIKCYTGFSSVFLLFGFIAYSNRIAMYSWFLIPILIFYPILYKKKHSTLLLFLAVLASFSTSFIYSPFIAYK